MLLLPAPSPPPRTIFVGVRRIAKQSDVIYLPAWCASTVSTRLPEPEILPVETPIEELFADIKRELRLEFQMTSAVLAMCQGRPFDSTLLKGIAINVA